MSKDISDSYATLGQAFLLMFFIPTNIILWIVVINANFRSETLLFATVIALISFFIIKLAFKFADVSIENGLLIVKKLFFKTTRDPKHFKKIEIFSVLGYYLEFTDGKRIYVAYGPTEIAGQVFGSNSNKMIDKIKKQIESFQD